jgi:predicted nucleic acid-binding Zn ribbon protein
MEPIQRNCRYCGSTLRGRQDKKFCDDACRNTYNNQQQGQQSNLMRAIHRILRKNRAILLSKLPVGSHRVKVSKDCLAREGFDFRYITHSYFLPLGKEHRFCYEIGYTAIEGDRFSLIREKLKK